MNSATSAQWFGLCLCLFPGVWGCGTQKSTPPAESQHESRAGLACGALRIGGPVLTVARHAAIQRDCRCRASRPRRQS